MGLFFTKTESKEEKSKFRSKQTNKIRLIVIGIFILALVLGCLDYPIVWNKAVNFLNSEIGLSLPNFYNLPFRLGLDLQGGTHLVYEADLSEIEEKEESMDGIRDVIERRVNLYGVTEPTVQINKVKDTYRLIVELPGVKDIHQAISMIGETPYLEFKTERTQAKTDEILRLQEEGNEEALMTDAYYLSTELTGRYLKNAQLEFNQTTNQPLVSLEFDDEGAELFAEITKNNVGRSVAIYLDGVPISIPTVEEEILGGKAQISGGFTVDQAKQLAQRLNAGALPVPITLISQQSVGASLGHDSLDKSLKAAIIGLILVALFMIIYYRVPGVLAVIALGVYTVFILAIFKLIPVTLTLAGIAGFILSVGMAVDANVLIFERMKEERKAGRDRASSIDEGFKRAWPSIRDGNVSTIITSVILYWFGTSIVKGFALTLLVGVLVSMFSAIILTRYLLKLSTRRQISNP